MKEGLDQDRLVEGKDSDRKRCCNELCADLSPFFSFLISKIIRIFAAIVPFRIARFRSIEVRIVCAFETIPIDREIKFFVSDEQSFAGGQLGFPMKRENSIQPCFIFSLDVNDFYGEERRGIGARSTRNFPPLFNELIEFIL